MPIKSVKIKISKNKKMCFFLMFQGSLDPKIRFLGQKVSSVGLQQTDTKVKNGKMRIFIKIGLKIKISKKNFWTNYNFRLLKSIPKFNFLSQKMAVLSPVIFNKDYIAKNSKIGIFSPKMNFSKNKKMRFFLMFQGSLDPKIRFLGQKVSSVALVQTDRRTDRHESEY